MAATTFSATPDPKKAIVIRSIKIPAGVRSISNPNERENVIEPMIVPPTVQRMRFVWLDRVADLPEAEEAGRGFFLIQ